MSPRNCNHTNDEDDDDGNGNPIGSGHGQGTNTNKAVEPVWPDHCSEDGDNATEHDDTRALKWLPMCSRFELATKLVSHPSRIYPIW
jgi:hypothetical protein